MPTHTNKRKQQPKPEPVSEKLLKRKRDHEDHASLQRKVDELDPEAAPLAATFTELPLSSATASGLSASHFKTLTAIQQKAIPLALKGGDVLGAARTGSGKTLAFLVPVLENLVRRRWTEYDGLGALILSPTRELAIQIFDVLRKIGRYHAFSAGLVIGGKSLQEEQERLGRMNILVATPGRILQHLDQTSTLDVGNLQMLVLDEADRILDMGFQSSVDAIVEHLPPQRQTLLFSATQTKRVSDLARLSLKDPAYVSVHEGATSATPTTLKQHYVVTPLQDKLDTLWSFVRANLRSKTLIFLSSGKQVRFVYESFRHLQPGVPLLHLHGRQKQTQRLDITHRFAAAKNACLFATDVVARGLDFPAVDWVIQLDCPEDADTYIHRVGRTARFERDGRAVLFLEPSEQAGMLARLEQRRVPIEPIRVRANKQQSIKSQLQNMCFKDAEVKYLGQKAFISYVKSVHLQKDKEIFHVQDLPLEEFAASLGLPGAPRIKFQKGQDAKLLKNASRQAAVISSGDEDEEGDDDAPVAGGAGHADKRKDVVKTKYDRMFERRNNDVFAPHRAGLVEHDDADTATATQPAQLEDADEDDGFLTVKRRLSIASVDSASRSSDDNEEPADPSLSNEQTTTTTVIDLGPNAAAADGLPIDSKRREKLLKSKKALLKYKGKGHKVVFDEETGEARELYEMEDEAQFHQRGTAADQRDRFLEAERLKTATHDELDRDVAREKMRTKRERRKERERMEEDAAEGESGGEDEFGVQLVPYEEGPEKQEDAYGSGTVSGSEDGGLDRGRDGDRGDDEGDRDEDVDMGRDEDRAVPTSAGMKPKRAKKWFEDDSDGDGERGGKGRKKRKRVVEEAETLEDLEALATSYL